MEVEGAAEAKEEEGAEAGDEMDADLFQVEEVSKLWSLLFGLSLIDAISLPFFAWRYRRRLFSLRLAEQRRAEREQRQRRGAARDEDGLRRRAQKLGEHAREHGAHQAAKGEGELARRLQLAHLRATLARDARDRLALSGHERVRVNLRGHHRSRRRQPHRHLRGAVRGPFRIKPCRSS